MSPPRAPRIDPEGRPATQLHPDETSEILGIVEELVLLGVRPTTGYGKSPTERREATDYLSRAKADSWASLRVSIHRASARATREIWGSPRTQDGDTDNDTDPEAEDE